MIDTFFHVTWLFVQQEAVEIPDWGLRAQEVFKGWKNTHDVFPVRTFGYILAGVLLVLAALWFRQWLQDRPKNPTAHAIFRRLAHDLNLSLRDQWLLVRISRHQQLPSPMTLMLSRQTYDHHAQAYIAQLADIRRPGVGQRVQQIESRLFGTKEQSQADLLAVLAASKFKLPTAQELARAGVGLSNVTQPGGSASPASSASPVESTSPQPAAG